MDYFSHPVVSSLILFALIYCVRLLHDWSVRLYHHTTYIYYFVVSYLFLHFCSVLCALFCAAIRSYSVSLLRFFVFSHFQVFSCEIMLVSRLKCQYNYFSFSLWFLVIVCLISLSFIFFHVIFESLDRCFDALFNSGNPLPASFLGTYSLWNVSLSASSWILFVEVLSPSTSIWSQVSYEAGSQSVYPFDEISAI